MNKSPRSIALTPQLTKVISAIAQEHDISFSSAVRQMLTSYLTSQGVDIEKPLMT